MPKKDDLLLSDLRNSHDANRTEFSKHTSIVSVAGLGFNLIENRPDPFAYDLALGLWIVSTSGFLIAILCVLRIFSLKSNHAEAQYGLFSSASTEDEEYEYLERIQQYEKSLEIWGKVLFLAFTIAVPSAILVMVNNLFF